MVGGRRKGVLGKRDPHRSPTIESGSQLLLIIPNPNQVRVRLTAKKGAKGSPPPRRAFSPATSERFGGAIWPPGGDATRTPGCGSGQERRENASRHQLRLPCIAIGAQGYPRVERAPDCRCLSSPPPPCCLLERMGLGQRLGAERIKLLSVHSPKIGPAIPARFVDFTVDSRVGTASYRRR